MGVEKLRGIMWHVYRMPLTGMVVCALLSALLFARLCQKFADRRWLRPCIGITLAAWFAIVLWMTVLKRIPGSYDVNWVPLHSYPEMLSGKHPEALRSSFMNVMLFFPAGLLWGGLKNPQIGIRKWIGWMAALFALFSLGIELSQYWLRLGVTEADDILHNTLGAVLGYVSHCRIAALLRKWWD